jgi:chemotaxis protein CheX
VKTTTEPQADTQREHDRWIPVLDLAVREVFELMLGCKLTASDAAHEGPLDITAMVGLAGKLCGVLRIQCTTESSTIMASKMLELEPAQVGPEMCDAFGEICNMVAGNFKNKIEGLGNGCMLSVPTVITGSDYDLYSLTDSPSLQVRLLFEGKPVIVALQIHS